MNDNSPKYSYLSSSNTIKDILNNRAFNGFGQLILPWDNKNYDTSLAIKNIGTLLPYHSNVNPQIVTESLNYMIKDANDGKKIFYDFYDETQKKADTSKSNTGIFFFRGKPNAPFAIICPGGGFSYVGSLHEGFPYAMELSRQGYNAFVLKYRAGSGSLAVEDLKAALLFIIKNSQELGINPQKYSLWGSSAGARMAAYIGSHSIPNIKKPSSIIMAYTGYTDFSPNDPATFIVQGGKDWIVNVSDVEKRIEKMKKLGINVEYHYYKNMGHGFGLGTGTEAEGWIDLAIKFFEKNIK